MMNKITIGCANIGYDYGIDSKKINSKEIRKIFNFCNEKKIRFFDTADSYENSYKILKTNSYNIELDTKILINNKWLNYDFCERHMIDIKKKINEKKIDTLYIHNPDFLLKKNSKNIVNNLKKLKKNRYYKKLGISIYDFETFFKNFRNFKFDVVQCPLNIFDQRLIKGEYLKKFKKLKLKVHIRSIFLQGLLINKKFKESVKFKKYKKLLNDYFLYLKNKKIKPLDLCLNYIFKHKNLDKIIIGINSKNQLDEIVNFKQTSFNSYDQFDYSRKKELIDPRRW